MVFVTHDQIEAMTMGDRIGVMREGRLEQIGRRPKSTITPKTLRRRLSRLAAYEFPRRGPRACRMASSGSPTRAAAGNSGWTAAIAPAQGGDPRASAASDPAQPAGALLSSAVVYAIEQLGDEAIVICDGPAGEKIRAIVQAGFSAPVGARLDVTFDGAAAHLFDPDTGRVLAEAEAL